MIQEQEFNQLASPIARKIWGSTDCIALIFAGAAAEFSVIKAVDWLFFTNKLPSDPLNRLFDTVAYAQKLFFLDPDSAEKGISDINKMHQKVETARNDKIPDWAYLDVLYMLIDYSEKAHELVFGPLTLEMRQQFYKSAMIVGNKMMLKNLPGNYEEYLKDRKAHLKNDYEANEYTLKLQQSYKDALGMVRYSMILKIQSFLVPDEISEHLNLKKGISSKILKSVLLNLPGKGQLLFRLRKIVFPDYILPRVDKLHRN